MVSRVVGLRLCMALAALLAACLGSVPAGASSSAAVSHAFGLASDELSVAETGKAYSFSSPTLALVEVDVIDPGMLSSHRFVSEKTGVIGNFRVTNLGPKWLEYWGDYAEGQFLSAFLGVASDYAKQVMPTIPKHKAYSFATYAVPGDVLRLISSHKVSTRYHIKYTVDRDKDIFANEMSGACVVKLDHGEEFRADGKLYYVMDRDDYIAISPQFDGVLPLLFSQFKQDVDVSIEAVDKQGTRRELSSFEAGNMQVVAKSLSVRKGDMLVIGFHNPGLVDISTATYSVRCNWDGAGGQEPVQAQEPEEDRGSAAKGIDITDLIGDEALAQGGANASGHYGASVGGEPTSYASHGTPPGAESTTGSGKDALRWIEDHSYPLESCERYVAAANHLERRGDVYWPMLLYKIGALALVRESGASTGSAEELREKFQVLGDCIYRTTYLGSLAERRNPRWYDKKIVSAALYDEGMCSMMSHSDSGREQEIANIRTMIKNSNKKYNPARWGKNALIMLRGSIDDGSEYILTNVDTFINIALIGVSQRKMYVDSGKSVFDQFQTAFSESMLKLLKSILRSKYEVKADRIAPFKSFTKQLFHRLEERDMSFDRKPFAAEGV